MGIRVASRRPLIWASIGALVALVSGCGTDVDLGGSSDGGAPEATLDAGASACAPCTMALDCASGAACAQFAGDTFCAPLCPTGTECAASDACQLVTAANGETTRACVPKIGACAPVNGPVADGGPLTKCGVLYGPPLAAACHACGRYSNDCQPNGCYGGYWCDTTTRDCRKPPASCP